MSRFTQWSLAGLVLLAFFLRLPGLFSNTFHADEALFAGWARLIAVWRDPLLQTQLVDKPPLLFYLQALFYPLFGPVDWAARLPNFIASLLLLPLTVTLVRRLYRDEVAALAAAVLLTLSPLAIQFSATAFTDPLLTTLLTTAMVMTNDERRTTNARHSSAIWFGLALATKYQAILFLPLLLALLAWQGWRWRAVARWLGGVMLVWLPVAAWEIARTGGFTLWTAQMSAYGGVRLIWSWELWPRLVAWAELWRLLFGSPLLFVLFLLLLPGFIWFVGDGARPLTLDWLLGVYLLIYFLLHWFVAVPVWDRYLLPVVPLVAVVSGRMLSRLFRFVGVAHERGASQEIKMFGLLSLLLLLQLPGGWAARDGRFPVGGQATADGGVAQVAAFLADAPYGTVLYDHWWSWHWRYYLFDKCVYLSWFPHPAALLEDLSVFAGDGHLRYLALPAAPPALPVQRAMREAGYSLQPVFTAYQPDGRPSIFLYQIVRQGE
jgi:4-amino-4-deoxy-L-arabinose transferase-like glycosyltransferase